MKNFIIFAAGFCLSIIFIALGMFMDPGFISFTYPNEFWAIKAHRKQTDSTIFVVGQKNMDHLSEFNSQHGLVVRSSGSKELNEKTCMEVMNALHIGTRSLLYDAKNLEPHVKNWIDKENNSQIRGKKLYKKNISPVIINKSILYKERFNIYLGDEWCVVRISKLEYRVDGAKSIFSCSGCLEGKEESSVVFSSRGDIVSGSIRTPNEVYDLHPAPRPTIPDAFQVHVLGNIDPGAFVNDKCRCDIELPCKCDKCKCVNCCCRFDCR
jgi:hypothetical protein